MFDRLTTLPHGLRVFVEALLYGLQYILMLPARDAPLHAGGAALLERTVATRICPIASQLLPVLLVRIVVLQLFASRTAIRILVANDAARALADTEAFEQSRRDRKRVEMLFAHLKRILRLGRLRLRGPRGAQDEFTLAAIAQNLRRLAKLVARPPPTSAAGYAV